MNMIFYIAKVLKFILKTYLSHGGFNFTYEIFCMAISVHHQWQCNGCLEFLYLWPEILICTSRWVVPGKLFSTEV